MNKTVSSLEAAVRDIPSGATVLVGGFGEVGQPIELLDALLQQGAAELTIISNNAGREEIGLGGLVSHRRVKRLMCSYPVHAGTWALQERVKEGQLELVLVPQGSLAERMRAAGAGLGGILTPTGVGTEFARGKDVLTVDGQQYVLEKPLHGDFSLVKAYKGDRWGNLVFRKSARNFNPLVAMAGRVTIAQVEELVELGSLDPDEIHTPGIFVDRIIKVAAGGGH